MGIIITSAKEEDAIWIKQLYKDEKEHIGDFNLFYVWVNYIGGTGTSKFIVIGKKAFMRYRWSVQANSYIIDEMAVGSLFKKEGLGKHLVQSMMKKAARENKKLTVKCNATNDAANQFYERCGLQFEGEYYTKNRGTKQFVWTT